MDVHTGALEAREILLLQGVPQPLAGRAQAGAFPGYTLPQGLTLPASVSKAGAE